MTNEPKYQFQHGPPERKHFTREEAIQDMKEFMEYLRKHTDENLEPVWYLYLQNDMWYCIGGTAVEEFGAGERIQEFKV